MWHPVYLLLDVLEVGFKVRSEFEFEFTVFGSLDDLDDLGPHGFAGQARCESGRVG